MALMSNRNILERLFLSFFNKNVSYSQALYLILCGTNKENISPFLPPISSHLSLLSNFQR